MKEMNDTKKRDQQRIRLPENIWAQIEIYSKSKKISRNQVITTAVEEYLAKNTNNETIFLEAMNTLTRSFQQVIHQQTYIAELVNSLHNSLDSISGNLNKVEYENRTQLILFLDSLRYSYSLFRKEIDSKERTRDDFESSIRFLNSYIQEFGAFRNKYGANFIKQALETNSIIK